MKISLSVVLVALVFPACGQFKEKLNFTGFGTVRALAIDSAARELFVASDGLIAVFDLDAYRQKEPIRVNDNATALVAMGKGRLIMLGQDKILLLDRSGHATVAYGNEAIAGIRYDPATGLLYAVSAAGKLLVFKTNVTANLQLTQTISLSQKITSVAVSAKAVALGLDNGDIQLYNKQKLTPDATLKGHTTRIHSMAFSRDGSLLASASDVDPARQLYDQDVILWNVRDQKIRSKTTHPGQFWVGEISIVADHVIVPLRLSIEILDFNGRLTGEVSTNLYYRPVTVAHGQKFIYGISDHAANSKHLYLVDVAAAKVARTFTFHGNPVWQLNFTRQGDLAITLDNEVKGIDKTGNMIFSEKLFVHSGDLVYKSDAFAGISLKKIAETQPDSITLCDFRTRKVSGFRIPPTLVERRFSADFVYDGKDVFIMTNKYLQKAGAEDHIIDFTVPRDTSSTILSIINRDDFFNVVSPARGFIPGSGYFYEFDPAALVINIRKNSDASYIKQIKGYKVVNVTVPGSLFLFHPVEKALYTWDLSDFNIKKLQTLSTEPYTVAWSPDKTRLAVKYSQFGNEIDLVDLKTHDIKPLVLTSVSVTCMAFTPNGKYLLTGTASGEIGIWDLKTRTQTGSIFTSCHYKDYVILGEGVYDGTVDGIKYLITPDARGRMRQVKNLFSTYFD